MVAVAVGIGPLLKGRPLPPPRGDSSTPPVAVVQVPLLPLPPPEQPPLGDGSNPPVAPLGDGSNPLPALNELGSGDSLEHASSHDSRGASPLCRNTTKPWTLSGMIDGSNWSTFWYLLGVSVALVIEREWPAAIVHRSNTHTRTLKCQRHCPSSQ